MLLVEADAIKQAFVIKMLVVNSKKIVEYFKLQLKKIISLEYRNWVRIKCKMHPIEYRDLWPDIADITLNPGDVVIDVGANVGSFIECCMAYQPMCRTIAFEPLPNAFEILQKKFSNYSRVKLENMALGSDHESLPINVSIFSEASSFLDQTEVLKAGLYGIDFSVIGKQTVPVVKLSNYLSKLTLDRVKLLKIDTQGYELEVLKGAQEVFTLIEYIYIEGAFSPLYENQPLVNDIQKYLQHNGFLLYRMCSFRTDQNGNLLECDMIFRNKERLQITH